MNAVKTLVVPSIIAFLGCGHAVAATYHVVDLGENLNFEASIRAYDINEHGVIAGWLLTRRNRNQYAFVWSPQSQLKILPGPGIPVDPRLGSDALSFSGYATTINNRGVIAGFGSYVTGEYGLIWKPSSRATFIGDLPRPSNAEFLHSINDDDVIVGYSGSYKAIIWDEKNGLRELKDVIDVPTGWSLRFATDISNSNFITGYGIAPDGATRAFSWSPATGFADLGDLPGGSTSSEGWSVNVHGQITGASVAADGRHGVLWDPINGVIDLGAGSIGHSINDLGVVVGSVVDSAFIWDVVNGMRDLNSLIDPSLEVRLFEALKINNRGWIIANGDKKDSDSHAFLLVPIADMQMVAVPIPASIVLIIFGFATLGIIRGHARVVKCHVEKVAA